ncbi:putative Bacteriohemerythrin [uncultured Gammaproteobacteria bacterium]
MTIPVGVELGPLGDEYIMDICDNLKKLFGSESDLVGIKLVDDQHSAIIERYNAIVDCLGSGDVDGNGWSMFKDLLLFFELHFAFEEKMMRIMKYPGFITHERIHARFIGNVSSFVEKINENEETFRWLMTYVGQWFLGHAVICDEEFGEFEALYSRGFGSEGFIEGGGV